MGTTASARRLSAQVYAGFLVAQAVCGVALWVALAASPTARSWFELDPTRPEVMEAFALADLALIVVGSTLGAVGLLRDRSWAVPVVAFNAGGVVYPTLYLLVYVATTDRGTVPLAVMLGTSMLSCFVAWQTWRLFR